MLLALCADLRKRRFHAGEHVGSFPRGMQRARGKREFDAECVVFFSRVLLDIRVQQYQVRRIAFEELVQLRRLPMRFFFDGLAPFFLCIANRKFHGRTFPERRWEGVAIRGSIRKRMAIPEYQFANAVANSCFPDDNQGSRTASKSKLRGYFLKRFSNAWRASRGRETRSGEAEGPEGGADGAVSFSIVVRNS
jgi:hypothetical protein